ncbi:MAG: ArsR family transcriptional regulator [Chloroflexi bacterium]|nr:ArsR family transcriptional regulator [Chloroflexota bacterium]
MFSVVGETRQRILDAIRDRGSMSVEQMAQALELSSPAIRRHLDILQRDHLVYFRLGGKKPGRPEYIYVLTEAGHEAGYRDYPQLLTLLLNNIRGLSSTDLAEKEGAEVLNLLMDRVSDQLNATHLGPPGSSTESRLSKLESALTVQGFAPRINYTDGHAEIHLCNCPFRAAAMCEESVCRSDQRLISSIMGVEPELQACIRDGAAQCTYLVKLNDSTA